MPLTDDPFHASAPAGLLREQSERDEENRRTLADFSVGPKETLCPDCWTIHRPEVDCE